MAQSIPQIRTDIEQTKGNINSTVNELGERLQEMKDWKTIVQRYPLPSLAASVVAGLVFSGAISPFSKNIKRSIGQTLTATASAFLMQQLKERISGERTVVVTEPR